MIGSAQVLLLDAAGDRVPMPVGHPDDPDWQKALKAHRDRIKIEPALCTCTTPAPKITVRQVGVQERLFLAIYPESGSSHHPDCPFWRPNIEQSGRKGYIDRVVNHDGENLVVRLRHGMNRAPPPADTTEVRTTGLGVGQPRRRQRAMSALGLLHLLWEEARINHWHPRFSDRRWWPAITALRAAAGHTRIRQRGQEPVPVVNRCVFVPPFPGEQDKKAQAEVLWTLFQPDRRKRGGDRLMVVGQVSGFWDKPRAVRVAGLTRLYLNLVPDDFERLYERHTQLAASSDQVVGLFMLETQGVDRRNNMRCAVIDAGMMACTKALIPVDSRLEHEVASRLIQNERRFYKPLRYDAEVDAVLPDFVLLDAGTPYPMEVYGMATPAYEARREEKQAYYDEQFAGRCWSWDAVANDPMPAFPARVFR